MASQKGNLICQAAYRYRVFGNEQFPGNPTTITQVEHFPAAAELLEHSRSLATEDNAYFMPVELPLRYRVETFSHTAPIKVCGHALLATACHLFSNTDHEVLILETPGFTHTCTRDEGKVWLGLPRYRFQEVTPLTGALLDLLNDAGLGPQHVERVLLYPFKVFVVIVKSVTCLDDFMLEQFKWHNMQSLEPGALIISGESEDGSYVYRYFSPWWGKPEDTATGSAHCYLAPYWLKAGRSARTRQISTEGAAFIDVILKLEAVWISGNVDLEAELLCGEALSTMRMDS